MGSACCCCAKEPEVEPREADITNEDQSHQQRLATRGARYVVDESEPHEPIAADPSPPSPPALKQKSFPSDFSAFFKQEQDHRALVEAEELAQRNDLRRIYDWHYDRTVEEVQQIVHINEELTVVHSPSKASSVSRGGGSVDRVDDEETSDCHGRAR